MGQLNSGDSLQETLYMMQLWDEEKQCFVDLNEAYLQEAMSYKWRISSYEQVSITMQGMPLYMKREGNEYSGTIQMPFQCGKIEFEITLNNIRYTVLNFVYSDERKVTQKQYEVMIMEIIQEAAVCFQFSSLSIDLSLQGMNRKTNWSQWDYIDSSINKLRIIFNSIESRPLRILKKHDTLVELQKVKKITIGTELWINNHREYYEGTQEKLPNFLKIQKVKESYDVYENRTIKKQINELKLLLKKYTNSSYEQVNKKAEKYLELINYWNKSSFLSTVKVLKAKISITQVFRKHPLYKKWYTWFEELNNKGNNQIGFNRPMPLADTFQVYEIWAFMMLVKCFRELELVNNTVDIFSYTNDGLFLKLSQHNESKIVLKNQGALYYQRVYQLNSPIFYSFTQRMIPDIVWEQNGSLMVFDPKYRVENNLPNALAEMHKYRDGIISRIDDSKVCKETYIICPNKGADYKNLFSDTYRNKYGMGAFEFKPGCVFEEYKEWIWKRVTG